MKFLAGTILAIFLGLMFISLFHMPTPMNMGHGHGMSDCPSQSQGALCSMHLTAHVDAWKTVFANIVVASFMIVLGFVATILIISTPPHLPGRMILHLILAHRYQRSRMTTTHIVRPLQELFSRGILHPKVF